MRALLFALLSYTRAYQLPRSRRALVVPQRRYDLQPRSTPDDEAPADAVDEAPAAPSRPARYDVTKLVDSSEGPGFNQFDPVLTATRRHVEACAAEIGLVGQGNLVCAHDAELRERLRALRVPADGGGGGAAF